MPNNFITCDMYILSRVLEKGCQNTAHAQNLKFSFKFQRKEDSLFSTRYGICTWNSI